MSGCVRRLFMEKRYIIQVTPLIPLPVNHTQIFSYWHSEDLPVGTLVSIPFYFREIQGIVVKSGIKFPLGALIPKLKSINSIKEKNFLSENQIELARRIAEYYFAPLGSVLELMLPKVARRKTKDKKISKKAIKYGKIGEIALKILESRQAKFLLIGKAKQRERINIDLIRAQLKKNKQCLILAPEIFFSQSVFDKLSREFSEEIALIHSRTTKGQFYDWWKRIKSGEIKIIIASQQGIFLPFLNLGIIIVQEEGDISFKQWKKMPRYNAALGAEFLADLMGAKLILESSLPSIESWHRVKEKWRSDLHNGDRISRFPKLEIVQLEGKNNNSDFPISKVLYNYLASILGAKKQAVIFVNRRGFSTRTICENCKKVLKCPKCGRALVYSEDDGEYRCLHCAFKKDLFSACPSCGGFQFSHRGIGTQTVASKVKNLFPSARVERIDADILKTPAKYKDIWQKFLSGEIDVLVGTQSAIKGIYSKNIGLAASISGRDFADGIEFNSRETALSRLFHMANLLREDGILLVQSFFGGNPLFDFMKKWDLKKYFDQEIKIRKKYGYPPFRKFLKIAYRDKSERKVKIETKKIFDLLAATRDNRIEITNPYEPAFFRKSGLYQLNILIKFDPEKNIQDLSIRAVIGGLRKGWSVDVDPVNLFS